MKSERLVSDISLLKENLDDLTQLYIEVVGVLNHEHDLIKARDLEKIEILTKEKVELGQRVESACEILARSFERMKMSAEAAFEWNVELVDISSLLERLRSSCTDSYEDKIIEHELNKLENSYQEFKATKESFQPKIEMNRYLVKNLLEQHQETFRFWQSIAAESESTYGSKGESVNQGSKSTLQVRT